MKPCWIINHVWPFHLHWKLEIKKWEKANRMGWQRRGTSYSVHISNHTDRLLREWSLLPYSCIVLSYGFLDKLIDPKWLLHHVTGTSLLLLKAVKIFLEQVYFTACSSNKTNLNCDILIWNGVGFHKKTLVILFSSYQYCPNIFYVLNVFVAKWFTSNRFQTNF